MFLIVFNLRLTRPGVERQLLALSQLIWSYWTKCRLTFPMNCVQVSPEPVQVMIPINCCLIGRTLQVTLAVARWVQTLSTPITQVHRLKVCLIVECLIEMKVFLRVFAVFGLCVCVCLVLALLMKCGFQLKATGFASQMHHLCLASFVVLRVFYYLHWVVVDGHSDEVCHLKWHQMLMDNNAAAAAELMHWLRKWTK